MVSERANAEAAVRDTAVLQNQDLERRLTQANRLNNDLSLLINRLEDNFAGPAVELSAIEPVEGSVVIRNVPTLDIPDSMTVVRMVHVPVDRPVAVRAEFFRDQNNGRYSSESEPLPVSMDFDGDQPMEFPLMQGIRRIGITFNYKSKDAKPYVQLSIDESEVARWTAFEGLEISGYGASTSTWTVQHAYKRKEKLPRLLKLSPSGTETELRFSLVDNQKESKDE